MTTLTPTIVEARFSGGYLSVACGTARHDEPTQLVMLDGPNFSVALFPREARDLADVLIRYADRAS